MVNALDCLTILCRKGFLRKRILLEMIARAFPLLCYPSQWVRRLAVTFFSASSERLGPVDSFVYLSPDIRPFLRRQPATLSSKNFLLSCLKPPVSKEVFYQVVEIARSSDMLERQRKIWYKNPSAKSKDTVGFEESNSVKTWSDKLKDLENQILIDSVVASDSQADFDSRDTKLRAETFSSEKLQYSGLVASHLVGSSLMYDNKPNDGIPLYSFSMDRQAAGNQLASASSLQVNSLVFDSSSMPWMDTVSKSFSLASSVPAPKLVSGSYSVNTNSKQFYRVVHEPEGKEFYQANAKETTVSVKDASTQFDVTGLPSFTRTSSVSDSGWRPRGVLVAHLQEHRSAVNEIAVSSDHSFFVSASNDSTVKVWDSRKLQKDIPFMSRLTYHLEGSRALCATMLHNSAQVVVGASDGMIHIFSVDYISRGLRNVVEKYSGITDIKKKDIKEGAVLSLMNCFNESSLGGQTVMYSTQNGWIHLLDVRSTLNPWTLKTTPDEGFVSSLVAGPCGNWFVSGSSRGVLTLWDLRFLVPVNSWRYARVCPVERMCLFVPSNASACANSWPLVYVAAGCNEVSLWNAENGSCRQVMRVADYDCETEVSEVPWALARPSNRPNSRTGLRNNINLKYKVDELNDPPPRLPGIRSLLPLPGGNLLTGGTDLKIRRWDPNSPGRNYSVCGPTIKGLGKDEFYETRSYGGVQETRKQPLTVKLTAKASHTAAATDPAGCHRDSILSLAAVKLNQRLLLSSSRDGAIKVWK